MQELQVARLQELQRQRQQTRTTTDTNHRDQEPPPPIPMGLFLLSPLITGRSHPRGNESRGRRSNDNRQSPRGMRNPAHCPPAR